MLLPVAGVCRGSARCAAHSRDRRRRPTGLVVVALVQAEVLRIVGLRFGPLQHDRLDGPVRSWASGTLAPAIVIASGPPSFSTRRLFFTPLLARSVGLGPTRPPLFGPCPTRRQRLAIPNRTRRALRRPPGSLPRSDRRSPVRPTVGMAVDRTVVRVLGRQVVPLTAAAQPEDDRVQDRPGLRSRRTIAGRRVHAWRG